MKIGLKVACRAVLGMSMLYVAVSPAMALEGQDRSCGRGPNKRVVELTGQETVVELGEGLKAERWTFNGVSPGPTIEVCEGDTVRITLKVDGAMAHGLDSHAFKINAARFGPVGPGETMSFEKTVDTPGVFMYHCANGVATDQHIKMGMYGVMIVYPRKEKLRRAREIVVSENGVYGEPDDKGMVSSSTGRMDRNDAYFVLYNGKMKNTPIEVRAGELIRVYFVNAGPYVSAFHVIGTILDRAYEGGNPRNVVYGVQTYTVPAGSGGMFEFTIPEPGNYLLVDHDKLAQLQNGLVLSFVAK